jgi:glycine dehydrogenase subunit 1
MMLAATVYLSLLGRQGLAQVAALCARKAHYAAGALGRLPGYRLRYPDAPFFHEFVLRCPRDASAVARALAGQGILAGYPLGDVDPALADCLLVAVTEKRTRAEIDRFAAALAAAGA